MADLKRPNDKLKSLDSSDNKHFEQQEGAFIDEDVHNRTDNINARVVNPLAHLSHEELRHRVDIFCDQNGFDNERDVFHRGALAAKHANNFQAIPEISDADKATLQHEKDHKWSQSPQLWFCVATLSLGSMIQGWDNTGANGANLGFPQEFGIADRETLVGIVNAAPLLAGCFATWLADPLNNILGRRGVVFLTGLFCVGPVLGQAFTQSWQQLFGVRFLMGLAMSVKTSTVPIYSAETAPANIRGALTMFWQLWVAFGILAGFCSNLIFYRIGDIAWRVQLGSAFVPAVPLVILCWFCPESPRWLLKKRRYAKAYKAFRRLRQTDLQAARDMFYAAVQIEEESAAFGGTNLFKRLTELWIVPRIRRASIGGMIVMLAQQFSGINIMAFYSSTIFSNAGYNTKQCLLASLGFGLVNTSFALPAIWTIDTFGRRALLLFTFPFMAFFLFLVGACFYIPENVTARVPLIATFIYIFTAFYSPGIGPVPNVYASEAFPLSHREVGGSWSIFVNQAMSTTLTFTFPLLLAKAGGSGAFFFYAGLNLLATVMVFFGLPETKERTLEELDYIFAVPSGKFARYQLNTWLPYQIKRRVFMRRDAHLEPLYNLDEIEGEKTYVAGVSH